MEGLGAAPKYSLIVTLVESLMHSPNETRLRSNDHLHSSSSAEDSCLQPRFKRLTTVARGELPAEMQLRAKPYADEIGRTYMRLTHGDVFVQRPQLRHKQEAAPRRSR